MVEMTKPCPFMSLGSMKTGNYHVYCSEGDLWDAFGRICALEQLMFAPPDGDDWKPYTRGDVKNYCPKAFTAKEVYEKIRALQKKLAIELQKDKYALKHFEK